MTSRRVRTLLALGLGLVSTLAVFGSFIVQLHGPPPALQQAGSTSGEAARGWAKAWCLSNMARLQRELGEQAASCATAQHAPAALRRYRRWEVAWRRRFAVALERCDAIPDRATQQAAQALRALDAHYASAFLALGSDSAPARDTLRQIVAAQP